ncbi:rhodanese-related sulfurtransferase [bacterium]|nr:MAG: rhodanese-related sulfurtransferase [bacterium]
MAYQILLYYTYTRVADPAYEVERQRAICQCLNLKGRILIAEEGVNGTVEGTVEDTETFIQACALDPIYEDVVWKRSEGTGDAFPKLMVKARKEIVTGGLGDRDVDPHRMTGQRLSAEELHDWIRSDREFTIVDMRNDFEHAVGRFEGSVLPPMGNFRDLASTLPALEHLRDKTVVTVCTGGVRCEKATGFLLENGFADVYQLQDGIVSYMEKYPNQDFKGALYVFDGRITMPLNQHLPGYEMVGRCELCGSPSEHFENCANDACRRHIICCESCLPVDGSEPFCERECAHLRHVVMV